MVNIWRATVFIAGGALLAQTATSAELDLNLNGDSAKLSYAWEVEPRNLRLDTAWLHNQDRGDVINLGLHLVGEASAGDKPVTGGLGGKIFYVDPDGTSRSATALGIGGFLRYTLPSYDRFNVYGHAYFAPDVLAFGDGDRYQEIEARVGYSVLREADIYLGVRYSKVNFERAGSLIMDNGLHFGIQLRF